MVMHNVLPGHIRFIQMSLGKQIVHMWIQRKNWGNSLWPCDFGATPRKEKSSAWFPGNTTGPPCPYSHRELQTHCTTLSDICHCWSANSDNCSITQNVLNNNAFVLDYCCAYFISLTIKMWKTEAENLGQHECLKYKNI